MNKFLLAIATITSFTLVTPSPSALVDDRCNEIIDDHIDNPHPSPSSSNLDTQIQGRLAYALAAYYDNRNITTANAHVVSLNDIAAFVPDAAVFEFPGYFGMPQLIRMYADPKMRSRMSSAAQQDCREMIWRFINKRSKVIEAEPANAFSNWFTENHNAMCKSSYFLGAQLLKNAGSPYGPNAMLGDGRTLQEHYDAWHAYWKEYFKQRALNGIGLEVASPQYEKFTVSSYYNIADFAESASCRTLAQNMISLYWADVAQDFVKSTGIRGGAGARMYNTTYLTDGSTYSFRQWLYMYDWHNNDNGTSSHPSILCAATSSYRIPNVIRAVAVANKESYEYSSLRFGRVGADGNFFLLPSYLRRDTSANQDFVMGSLTFDPSKVYNEGNSQNRFMGVTSNSGVNDRIIVKGKGTTEGTEAGYWELNGACYKNVLVAARDTNAQDNNGTRIFLGGAFAANLTVQGSWLFTFAGNSYAAIRIATGGYTVTADPAGIFLEFGDMWSPILIQMAQASSYSSLGAFANAVIGRPYSYSGGKLSYTSLRNCPYEIWRQSNNVPTVNGSARNFTPVNTFSSPYLNGVSGQTYVTVSYPGFSNLTLEFDYAGSFTIINPVGDAQISNANLTAQYGSETAMSVKNNVGSGRISYVRFGLSSFQRPSTTKALLRLYISAMSSGTSVHDVYGLSNITWNESTMTWSSGSPNHDATGYSITGVGSSAFLLQSKSISSGSVGSYVEFDVTSYVNDALANGKSVLSFLVSGKNSESINTVYNTKEATKNRPELRITN